MVLRIWFRNPDTFDKHYGSVVNFVLNVPVNIYLEKQLPSPYMIFFIKPRSHTRGISLKKSGKRICRGLLQVQQTIAILHVYLSAIMYLRHFFRKFIIFVWPLDFAKSSAVLPLTDWIFTSHPFSISHCKVSEKRKRNNIKDRTLLFVLLARGNDALAQ